MLIFSDQVDRVWPLIQPFLRLGCERSYGTLGLAQIYQDALDSKVQLWLFHQDSDFLAGAATRIGILPPGIRTFEVFCAGGKKLHLWKDYSLEVWENFAKNHECSQVEIAGRKGWERELRSNGYAHKFSIMTKTIASIH